MDEMKSYSQSGEDIVIAAVFDTLGIKSGHLVDLGAGDGEYLSNSRALLDAGWSGILIDGDPKGAKDVVKMWITDRIALDLMLSRVIKIDFLNLDIDGNDYYILKAVLDACEPNLIVAEINPIFERNEAKVMPYNEAHVWKSDTYYGMSLAACEKLAEQYGYTLMHLHAGINAFLLRNDHAKAHPELIRPIDYKVKFDHARHNPALPWIELT